jgi:hypothetical protein
MQIFTLIPFLTWLAILICVVLPAVGAIILRLVLHTRIKEISEDKTPEFFKHIQERYQEASKKIEHVNTTAIIDSMYQRQLINCWKCKIQLDGAEGITRVLPNLLIAFGLIGTFIGITSNLASISTIVTNLDPNNPNIGNLLKGLELPLRDMGIAFSTSLFGLLFGSILTGVNTLWNTNIAKHQLISSLEDYLDNICNNGNTRLDLAVTTMVDQQKQFLDRFHENVGRVLASSFGAAAENITKECSEANKLAINIYTKLDNAAGTIATGASTFQYAATSLKTQTQNLANSLNEFTSGVETFKIAANQLEQNNIIQNLDRVLAQLNTSQQAFTNSTQTLQDSLVGITNSNETAAQLAKQVYETWQDSTSQIVAASETIGAGAIIFQQSTNSLEEQTQIVMELMPQLKGGVDTFVSAANKVKTNNIIKHLNTLVENLSVTQSAFTSSTQTLSAGVEGIMSSHQHSTQSAEKVYQGLEKTTASIQSGANNFVGAAQIIRDSLLAADLTSVATKWQNTQNEFTNSTAIFSQAATNLQPVTAKLEPAIDSIDRVVTTLQQFGSEVVSLSKNTIQVSESTKTAIAGFSRDSNQNLQSLESIKEYLTQINLTDRASMIRLSAILEKLEILLNTKNNDAFLEDNGGRKSRLFSATKLK